MARYRILYWQEIPGQISAADDDDEVMLPMSQKFFDHIDALAMQRGLHGTDDFLAHWQWGDEIERPGSAREVAEAVKSELEANTNW
jgi:hypothetical protein